MDRNLNEIEPTLRGHTREMKIVEEIAKNWMGMQEDLKSLSQDMAIVWESQMVVQGLMEGIT